MKLAVDSYCFHRWFGECYPGLETAPRGWENKRLDVWGFLEKVKHFGVAGVSLEACFLPVQDVETSAGFIDRLKDALDQAQLERVWAWGHPGGLHSGTDDAAAADLARHLAIARRVGADVMRICAGGRGTRPASWAQHKAGLVRQLRPLLEVAEKEQVIIAIENHIDLLGDELLELLQTLDSPWLGVCFDTANNLRMGEHPLALAKQLAPYIKATHIKDVTARRGDPKTFSFWPSVPVGHGVVEISEILDVLHAANYQGLLAVEIDWLHPQYQTDTGTGEEAALRLSLDYLKEQLTTLTDFEQKETHV